MTAAERWADALAHWGIPDEILTQAPADPWIHPPAMFRSGPQDPADTPSMRAAAGLLGTGGSVLDIGCGGGRSSLPLGPDLLREVTGVDEQQAMLDLFAAAAAERGIACRTVLGHWPGDAASTPSADVVVCHHVVYNVSPIATFVGELSSHASRGVVVELPDRHPQMPMNPLWKRFWGLDRPDEPTSDLFVEVVRERGFDPEVATVDRLPRRSAVDQAEFVAFVRQRLCLTPLRDNEVAAALDELPSFTQNTIVTVSWRTDA